MSLVQLRWPELVIKGLGPRRERHLLHIVVTTLILAATLLVIELVTDLGAVFSFVGGVAAISISLILPRTCRPQTEREGFV
jgi:amino acid permease